MSNDPRMLKDQATTRFNTIAGGYDQHGAFAHFGQNLVAAVGVEPGHHVLDVATGPGAVLFAAAERIGAAGKAIGVDIAENMVRAANKEAERRGLDACVRVMDAEQLDFPDGAFDRIFCGFGVMFFPNLGRALSEFRRVLKPGGRLGISTWRVSLAEDLYVVLGDLGLWGNESEARPGWITEPDVLASVLARAGFSDVRVADDDYTVRYADLGHYWQSQCRHQGASGRRASTLDPTQSEHAQTALAERFRAHERPDGIYVVATALLGVGRG